MQFKRASYQSPGDPGKNGFEDLNCYRLSLDVVVNAYELANHLPQEEKYDLAAQIRRSSKSITANIAEGYGRYHYLESLHHYAVARGELNETLAHIINARVLGYVDPAWFEQVYKLIRTTEQSLNGFMSYIRKQRAGSTEYGDRTVRESSAQYFYDDAEDNGHLIQGE